MVPTRSTRGSHRSLTTERRRRHVPRRSAVIVTAGAFAVNLVGPAALPAVAAVGDFSLDFAAAAPYSYNYITGGGAFDDGTIGVDKDVVESLEGGDYACGDIVTYFTKIVVDDTAAADDAQTIELTYSFTMDTTGQSGVAIGDITYAGINYGTIQDLIPGENTVDDGFADEDGIVVDDGDSVATLVYEHGSGPMFERGSTLTGTVEVTDLEAGEVVILRLDTQLYCQGGGTSPTGNLQGDLATAELTYIDDTSAVTPPQTIPGGAQTIPFKQIGDLQYPELVIQKTVTTEGAACPGVESLTVAAGDVVRYCYAIRNATGFTSSAVPGTAPLYDLVVRDDNATSGTADDFDVMLTLGLTDEDGDGFADDLAAGGSASGEALVTVPASAPPGTVTNTATVTGEVNVLLGGGTISRTDTASVVVSAAPAIDIEKTPDSQTVTEGDDATFTITVTNTGNVQLTDVTVTDPNSPSCAATIGALAVGATHSYPCSMTPTASFTNTATATGTGAGTQVTDSDSADVVLDLLPAVTVTKSANPTSVPETGGNVDFTFSVQNDSAEPVTITSLDDSVFGELVGDGDCTVGTELAAGASCSFTSTFAIPAGDVPGSHGNTFTAWVEDPQGNDTSDTDDETVTYTDVLPDVTLTKDVDPASVAETGGEVTYTYVVTNSSAEAATITGLSDDRLGTLTGDADCQVGTVLAGGASCSFTAGATIPPGDFPMGYTNVGTVTVADDDGNTDTGTDNATVMYTDVLPDVSLTKTADPTTVPESGDVEVVYTYVVTNSSAEAATITVLADDRIDPLVGDDDCQVGTVLLGRASCTFTATGTVPPGDAPGGYTNIGSVTVTDGDGNTDVATDDETVTYTDVPPTVRVDKAALPLSVPENGGLVSFTFSVTNTSFEPVTITALEDDVFIEIDGNETCQVGTVLDPGETCTFTETHRLSGDVAAPHTNVFTATVADDEGSTASDDDDATVDFADVAPTVVITKTPSVSEVPETGEDVTFTFVVTNTSDEPVWIDSLDDTDFGTLTGDADCMVGTELAPDAFCEFSLVRSIAGDFGGPDHSNTVTAVVKDNEGTTGTGTDDATVSFTDVAPTITVDKTASPTTVLETGGDVTYTFVVTNTGPEDVTLTSLSDDRFGELDGKGTCELPATILIGGAYTCTYTTALASDSLAPHTNVVTATAEDDDGTEATDTDDATVTFTDVAPAIQVTKTASPTSVPETGGNVVFTFEVENVGQEDVTLTSLSDSRFGDLDGQGTCDVPQQILIGGSYACTYSVFLSSDSLTAHSNVVTATAVDDDDTPATDTDDETVIFTDVAPMIRITKTANPTHVPETGGDVTFTFLVENIGDEDATLTSLTDSVFGDLNGQGSCVTGGLIAINGSYSCSITVFLSSDSLTDHTNVASIVVTDDDGTPASDTDDETVTFDDVAPAIRITKTADPTSVPETGGNVTFTFLVENIGQEDVMLTSLTDSVFGDLAGQGDCTVPQAILVGGSYSCSITKALASDSLSAHYDVATATAVDDDGTPATDDDSETVTFQNVPPEIRITKTASPASVPETGGDVTFTFLVENIGHEDVSLTSLEDTVFGDLDGQGTCVVPQTILIGGTYSCEITEPLSSDSLTDHDNVVTATAVDDDTTTTTDDDDETVTFSDVAPTISVTKDATPSAVPETGGDVSFAFTVLNTSLEAVTITSLSDSVYGTLAGDADCAVGTVLAAGASCDFTLTAWVEGDYSGPDHVDVFTAVAVDNDNTEARASDDATVDFTNVLPTIDVTKTADPTSVPETGADVTFTFVVKNTSTEEPVTITSLEDDVYGLLDGDADCAVGTVLAAGASCEFTLTQWVEGDYSGPDHVNVFTGTAVDNDGSEATDHDEAAVDFTDVAPAIEVTKTADPTSVPETGADVTFTFVVKNTSTEEPVTITSLDDDIYGLLDGDADCAVDTVLAAGASCAFTLTEWVEGDYSGPDHVNEFTAIAVDNDTTQATATDDATVDFTDVAPEIEVTKTANPTSVPETGGNVTFTFAVTNTSSEEPVTITALSDSIYGPLSGDADCTVGTVLAAGASCEFTLTQWVEGDYSGPDHVNVFTGTAVDNDGSEATDHDEAAVDFTDVAPAIEVTKTADPTSVPETGGNVTFTFVVKNTSTEEPVTITSLEDDVYGLLDGDADCAVGTVLAAGASCEFTLTQWVEGDYSGPDHVDVFTAVSADNDNTTATDTDDATVDFTNVLPTIDVTKTADPTSVPETGGNVTFTFVVTNTSSEEPVTITALSDSIYGPLSGDADCTVGTVLAAGASCEFTLTQWVEGDYSGPDHVDVFTAVAVDNDNTTATDTDDETVTYQDVLPDVSLTKLAGSATVPETGGTVTYTYVVTNNSAEAATITVLTDDKIGPLSGDADCTVTTLLAAGASCSFTATGTIPAGDYPSEYTNLGSVTVTDDDGNEDSATDPATVLYADVLPTIDVTKTANPTSVLFGGENVTFTVDVTNTSGEDVYLDTLTDDVFGTLDGKGTCDVPLTMPAGTAYSCAFTEFLSSTTFQTHKDVVTASGTDDEGNVASDTDDATVTFWWYGRTPGYWKNHPESWVGYTPSQKVQSIFAIPACIRTKGNFDQVKPSGADTLIQALGYQGGETTKGKAEILLRAAGAALLNERYYGDQYPPYASTSQLIAAVNSTLATCDGSQYIALATVLDGWNNGFDGDLP
ncbi:DUF11 domain-containing protein [Actinotalea sp. Marseille-Q4924]|uniref:DUF7507 domain-containing protein n=1 Tax=Actinotalea sp. Marseille-Q4924 TaxID=2866571 RepID=UPI001CE3CC58|nr:DUF11 domain-containing protein [Actinotalea sp. Marseille-Q4924]